MSNWQEGGEAQDQWPVRYLVESPPREVSGRHGARRHPRWLRTGKADTGEVQKRLLWLLLAVEMGMALAAVCVVPLIFVELPIQETGIIKALWARAGDLLDLSRQATRLILALILPLLLLVVSLSVWWFRHIQRTWNEPRSCREIE